MPPNSMYKLDPNGDGTCESVTFFNYPSVDPACDTGFSGNCPLNLVCGHTYALRGFAHSVGAGGGSAKSNPITFTLGKLMPSRDCACNIRTCCCLSRMWNGLFRSCHASPFTSPCCAAGPVTCGLHTCCPADNDCYDADGDTLNGNEGCCPEGKRVEGWVIGQHATPSQRN